MTDSKIVLIFIPPVKRSKISKFFEENVPNSGFYDIDTRLCQDLGETSIQDVVTNNSRQTLRSKWEESMDHILYDIKIKNKKLNIILSHPVYYNITTREFFSIFNSGYLIEKASENSLYVSHTVHVIDDIHDVFKRLTNEEELFGDNALAEFMERYMKSFNFSFKEIQKNSRAFVGWIQHCINSIVNWRAQEILLTQNIATQLNSKFILWAIKQNPFVLIDWFTNDKSIFYVSHPISEPRRYEKSNKKWPALVDVLNELQIRLGKINICSVMPTAIDEYRFEKIRSGYSSNLTKRWPIPSHTKSAFKKYNLLDDDQDKTNILNPNEITFSQDFNEVKSIKKSNVAKIQEYVNSAFNTLEITITESMANRDHTLVWHTNGVIVIEPYDVINHKIHGGVLKELDYLRLVNTSILGENSGDTPRKLCAVFEENTIRKIVESKIFKDTYLNKFKEMVAKGSKIENQIAVSIINENSQIDFSPTSLGRRVPSHKKSHTLSNAAKYQRQALAESFSIIALVSQNMPHIDVIMIPRIMDLNKHLNKIKDFLLAGKTSGWEDAIHEIAKTSKSFSLTKFY